MLTGGAGYLGSLLSRELLSKGYEVRVIDILWYGIEPIKECLENKKFVLIKDDIRNITTLATSMKDVDAVIHLASIVGMTASTIDSKMSYAVNYVATKNIAELCQLHAIDTYIFASTCSVYGSQSNIMMSEKSPTIPLDYYAEQKLKCEKAIKRLNKATTILRFGTLFGLSHRMRFDLVINRFIAQALLEGKITVFGGEQRRPFLHVLDAVNSVTLALEKNLTGTYNVVSENLSIKEAARRINKTAGCEIEFSTDIIDKRDYVVSAEKIRRFGFKPTKNIEFAFKEIKNVIDDGKIKDYNDKKYDNYKLLLNSKIV